LFSALPIFIKAQNPGLAGCRQIFDARAASRHSKLASFRKMIFFGDFGQQQSLWGCIAGSCGSFQCGEGAGLLQNLCSLWKSTGTATEIPQVGMVGAGLRCGNFGDRPGFRSSCIRAFFPLRGVVGRQAKRTTGTDPKFRRRELFGWGGLALRIFGDGPGFRSGCIRENWVRFEKLVFFGPLPHAHGWERTRVAYDG
jgi:hypothetical protein